MRDSRVGNLLPTRFSGSLKQKTAVGRASQPTKQAVGLCVNSFRLPEIISSVTVGKNAHPTNYHFLNINEVFTPPKAKLLFITNSVSIVRKSPVM
ncbi:MAG: hypothetical protein IKX14_06760 [Neisseriaceae bacterium]|nr:hypothetical protein [Neisseriaceae bacterium]